MDNNHKRKLVLGRKISYLKRCMKVVNILNQHETAETVRVRIFEKYVKPEVPVSYAQFNNMLNEVNPQKQLTEVENEYNSI